MTDINRYEDNLSLEKVFRAHLNTYLKHYPASVLPSFEAFTDQFPVLSADRRTLSVYLGPFIWTSDQVSLAKQRFVTQTTETLGRFFAVLIHYHSQLTPAEKDALSQCTKMRFVYAVNETNSRKITDGGSHWSAIEIELRFPSFLNKVCVMLQGAETEAQRPLTQDEKLEKFYNWFFNTSAPKKTSNTSSIDYDAAYKTIGSYIVTAGTSSNVAYSIRYYDSNSHGSSGAANRFDLASEPLWVSFFKGLPTEVTEQSCAHQSGMTCCDHTALNIFFICAFGHGIPKEVGSQAFSTSLRDFTDQIKQRYPEYTFPDLTPPKPNLTPPQQPPPKIDSLPYLDEYLLHRALQAQPSNAVASSAAAASSAAVSTAPEIPETLQDAKKQLDSFTISYTGTSLEKVAIDLNRCVSDKLKEQITDKIIQDIWDLKKDSTYKSLFHQPGSYSKFKYFFLVLVSAFASIFSDKKRKELKRDWKRTPGFFCKPVNETFYHVVENARSRKSL